MVLLPEGYRTETTAVEAEKEGIQSRLFVVNKRARLCIHFLQPQYWRQQRRMNVGVHALRVDRIRASRKLVEVVRENKITTKTTCQPVGFFYSIVP